MGILSASIHWAANRHRGETPRSEPSDGVDVGPVEALAGGNPVVVRPSGADDEVVVVRTRAGLFAVTNRCTHLGAALAEGTFTSETVTCPRHGFTFELSSGRCLSRGRRKPSPLSTWPVWTTAGRIVLGTPQAEK
jgi:nitrite reductase/ring-hydroxylating ferredoxin subunit